MGRQPDRHEGIWRVHQVPPGAWNQQNHSRARQIQREVVTELHKKVMTAGPLHTASYNISARPHQQVCGTLLLPPPHTRTEHLGRQLVGHSLHAHCDRRQQHRGPGQRGQHVLHEVGIAVRLHNLRARVTARAGTAPVQWSKVQSAKHMHIRIDNDNHLRMTMTMIITATGHTKL